MTMNPVDPIALHLTRRHFFARGARGIGTAALASLLVADGIHKLDNTRGTQQRIFATRHRR